MKIETICVLTLLLLAIMYIMGTRNGRTTKKGSIRTYSIRFYEILAVLPAAIIGLVIMNQALDSLTQMFDNLLLYDESSSAWSVILAIFVIEVITLVFYGLCLMAANSGRKVRHNITK